MELAEIPAGMIVVALLAAGARIGMAEARLGMRGVCSTLMTAAFLAISTFPYLLESSLTPGARTLAVAAVSFFSRDLLDIMLVLRRQVREDPLGLLRDFLNWRRGKDD